MPVISLGTYQLMRTKVFDTATEFLVGGCKRFFYCRPERTAVLPVVRGGGSVVT